MLYNFSADSGEKRCGTSQLRARVLLELYPYDSADELSGLS